MIQWIRTRGVPGGERRPPGFGVWVWRLGVGGWGLGVGCATKKVSGREGGAPVLWFEIWGSGVGGGLGLKVWGAGGWGADFRVEG